LLYLRLMKKLGFRFTLGVIAIVLGVLIAVEIFTGYHFPIVRVAIAVLLVIAGWRLIARAYALRDAGALHGEVVMSESTLVQQGVLDRDARFDVLFGRGTLDLTGLVEPPHDVTVTVGTVFGHALVKLPAEVAYDIEGSSAFGQVKMPDRTAVSTGSMLYRPATTAPPRVHLRVSTIFGACQVVEATPAK
jgi:predicted membrane protein